ncbi:hypothetical protein [Geodermatophilus africanus]|uniref:hypothetical protein n=1 Tax=Geodermatophilus africanus TaxID=1137993 RepID=UPI001FCCEEDA|nr:hypothetical protein [Geodermatophilus africanus]
MQPLLPLLADEQAVGQVLVEKDLVVVVDQPPVHLRGQRGVLAGMAYEDPGHRSSQRSSPRQSSVANKPRTVNANRYPCRAPTSAW